MSERSSARRVAHPWWSPIGWRRALAALLVLVPVVPGGAAAAEGLPTIAVIALGPMDGRAVVQSVDGRMQVLKVGDALAGSNARLMQVLADRIVLEDVVDRDGRDPTRELVWVFKADDRGHSRQTRLSPTAPDPRPVRAPN